MKRESRIVNCALLLSAFCCQLAAQPLTLGDPVYLVDYRPVAGCSSMTCPLFYTTSGGEWTNHVCGTIYGDEFTGYRGGATYSNGVASSGWVFSARQENDAIGFGGDGFNIRPTYCLNLPTVVEVDWTNAQAFALFTVVSNFAAVEPSGTVVYWLDATNKFMQSDYGSSKSWETEATGIRTQLVTQATLTAGLMTGWTGGTNTTRNLQVIADKHGATYIEFQASGNRTEENYQTNWMDGGWNLVATYTNELNVSYAESVNDTPTNYAAANTWQAGPSPGSYNPLPQLTDQACFAGVGSYDCGVVTFAGNGVCAVWANLNGDVAGLLDRWTTWSISGGDWLITNAVQITTSHAVTNWLSGGTGGWVTNFNNGSQLIRDRTSWSIYMVIANSYLYFDWLRVATNSICQ